MTVEHAGIKILNLLYTVNIKMEFRHPKYYKELRKRNKLDQAISLRAYDGERERATGPGPKPQASSAKLTKQQAASVKPRGTSVKLQAASDKLQDS